MNILLLIAFARLHQNLRSSLSFQPLGLSLRMVLFFFTVLIDLLSVSLSIFFHVSVDVSCIHICMHIYMCGECVYVYMCMGHVPPVWPCLWRSNIDTRNPSQLLYGLFIKAESSSQIQNLSIWFLFRLLTLEIPSPPSEAGIYKWAGTPTQCVYPDPDDPDSSACAASTLAAKCFSYRTRKESAEVWLA